MSFHEPSIWWLLGLLALPLLWLRWGLARRPGRGGGISYSSLTPLREAGVSWAVRVRLVVPALRTLALGLLVICVARPRSMHEQARTFTEGIAIQLIVDRSGSMLATDFELDRRRATRLEVVKAVVEAFVTGNEDLPGRTNDLLGMIAFATYVDSICPLTLDHARRRHRPRRGASARAGAPARPERTLAGGEQGDDRAHRRREQRR